jgi:hypothetical protein
MQGADGDGLLGVAGGASYAEESGNSSRNYGKDRSLMVVRMAIPMASWYGYKVK